MFGAWKSEFEERKKYSQPSRKPFYDIAAAYLPNDPASIVVDIGAGEGEFADSLHLGDKYTNCFLLDQNAESVHALSGRYKNTVQYTAPDKLPFEDGTVSFIHLSHIVEHLQYQDLYLFLKECDRVLRGEGILVLSTPLLWDRFYDDMSHIKPYNPIVFTNYLSTGRENPSASTISSSYSVKKLVYRYRSVGMEGFGSKYFVIDSLIRICKILLNILGFRRYLKNGYTLVLQKTKA